MLESPVPPTVWHTVGAQETSVEGQRAGGQEGKEGEEGQVGQSLLPSSQRPGSSESGLRPFRLLSCHPQGDHTRSQGPSPLGLHPCPWLGPSVGGGGWKNALLSDSGFCLWIRPAPTMVFILLELSRPLLGKSHGLHQIP